jgi:DNA invertase Pin-like site-specific DNA recombinase
MLIGYARISTLEQTLDPQIDALIAYGVKRENIHTDSVSAAAKKRPGFDLMWRSLRPGDVVVVVRLDRFARSMLDLLTRFNEMEAMGVGLKSLKEDIDTKTAGGRLVFQIMGALAEFERHLIIERTHAGLAAARARGMKFGRETVMTPEKMAKAREMYRSGHNAAAIAREIGVSRTTIINHYSRLEINDDEP